MLYTSIIDDIGSSLEPRVETRARLDEYLLTGEVAERDDEDPRKPKPSGGEAAKDALFGGASY